MTPNGRGGGTRQGQPSRTARLAAWGAVALLAACGSDDDDGGNPTGAADGAVPAFVGFVSLERLEADGVIRAEVSGEFHDVEPDAARGVTAFYRGEGCNVVAPGDEDSLGEPIDAGEAIVLSTPEGTFATVPRDDGVPALVSYDSVNADLTLDPPPAGLVLDVPGADFPAITAAPMPDVPPAFDPAMDVVAPALGETVDADTTFSWRGSSEPDVFLSIVAAEVIGDAVRTVSCLAVDDGTFSFPADVAAELGPTFAAPYRADDDIVRFERVRVGRHAEGDAVVFGTHAVPSD